MFSHAKKDKRQRRYYVTYAVAANVHKIVKVEKWQNNICLTLVHVHDDRALFVQVNRLTGREKKKTYMLKVHIIIDGIVCTAATCIE